MRPQGLAVAAALATAALLVTAGPASAAVTAADIPVTVDTAYVKANNVPVTPADPISACGANKRQQNEPSVAMDARNPAVLVAGSNDYCTVEKAGGTWTGYYRSVDSGRSWTDSLLPGYPGDASPEGKASPLQQAGITNAGDPVQAWDNGGNVFYMGNAFNRVAPQTASVWVATYSADGSRYERTVLVAKGTPAVKGKFNDKTSIEVDRGTASRFAGHVYVAWSVFQGNGNNAIYFARSTDHGATFSQPSKLSETVKDNQFADIAVNADGTVSVAWRETASKRGQQPDAVVWVRSTDGGASFTKPSVITTINAYDAADSAGDPAAAEAAREKAFASADGPESDAEPSSVGDSRDCGDGPLACKSGFVFLRHDSQPRITADPKAPGHTVYLTFDAIKPGTSVASTSTYNTATPVGTTLQVGQGTVFFSRFDGTAWSAPAPISNSPVGHQFFPDVNADGGVLHAVWHDSRNDPGYSVQNPPGNASTKDAQGFHLPTNGLDTYGATSRDGGATWTVSRLSQASQQPNYLMFGDRQVPFHGDYNYVSSVGAAAASVWTDTRQVVAGDDPRNTGGEGFQVKQCRAPATGPDTCPNAGGLDQDIFAALTTG